MSQMGADEEGAVCRNGSRTRARLDEMDTMDVMDKLQIRTAVFSHAYVIVWAMLIAMNMFAQLATSSPRHWTEMVFAFTTLSCLM